MNTPIHSPGYTSKENIDFSLSGNSIDNQKHLGPLNKFKLMEKFYPSKQVFGKMKSCLTTGVKLCKGVSTKLSNWMAFLAIILFMLVGSQQVKADSPVPEGIVVNYDHITKVLTIEVAWSWNDPDKKVVTAAVFADIDGLTGAPTFTDFPVGSWTSAGLANPLDEFLGQFGNATVSSIQGFATNTVIPYNDNSYTGIGSTATGMTANTARALFPYGLEAADQVSDMSFGGNPGGKFTLTYTNVQEIPKSLCVVLYDVHINLGSPNTIKDHFGKHSPVAVGPLQSGGAAVGDRNEDNSVEEGYMPIGPISCASLNSSFTPVDLNLEKTVSTQTPAVDDIITYTIVVTNETATATTGVEVEDLVPSGLVYEVSTIEIMSPATGTTNVSGSTLTWSDLTIPANGSVTLKFDAKVTGTGLIVNSAEITESPADIDSTPDNNMPDEDDQDNVCISVPIMLCSGDDYTLTAPAAPAGLTYTYQWKVDGVDISPGGDGQTLNITMVTGTVAYTFMIVDDNDCMISSDCPVIFTDEGCCTPSITCPTIPDYPACSTVTINDIYAAIETEITDGDANGSFEACSNNIDFLFSGGIVNSCGGAVGDITVEMVIDNGDGTTSPFVPAVSCTVTGIEIAAYVPCLLYTSDAADE